MTTLIKPRSKAKRKIRETLPNGKELIVVVTDGRIEQAFHHWPDGSWQSIDPGTLSFTRLRIILV